MSDILLSVGLQTGQAQLGQIESDLQKIVSGLDQNPPKIKVGLKVDNSALATFRKELEQIVNSVSLGNGAKITVNLSGIGQITSEASKAEDALERVAKAAKKTNNTSVLNNADKQIIAVNKAISTMTDNYNKWTAASEGSSKSAYDTYGQQLQKLQDLRKALQENTISAKDAASEFLKIQAAASNAALEIHSANEDHSAQSLLTKDTKEYYDALSQVNSLLESVRKNQEQWTAARDGSSSGAYSNLVGYSNDLQMLVSRLEKGELTAEQFGYEFGALKSRVGVARAEIKGAGEDTKSLGDRISDLTGKFTQYFGVTQVLMAAVNTVKKMVTSVIELDSAMTELKKVTDATDTTYERFLKNAKDRATSVGASLIDVVTATADYARLGYDMDEASKLADASIIYKNVADGLSDISEASNSIISTMQAFQIKTSDVMSIVDKFNNVSNNFAISSAGIGEAMQKSAAAMYAAGNDIDQTIALITAANTVVQNPAVVGTTLKTASMFLRAAKTEAEEAGESTDGMAESVSKLRSEILSLTGNKVDIQINEDEFKSTYDILKELAAVWGDLSDISQANILNLVGGKRNANVMSALLENFDLAEKVMQTSMNSEGSALAENAKYLDSIEGKLKQMSASFQSLSSAVVNSDFIKGLIDSATTLLNILTSIVDTFGIIGPMLAGGAVTTFVKNMESLSNFGKITEALTSFRSDKNSGIADLVKGIDLGDVIADLRQLGVGGEEITQILNKIGFEGVEVTETLEKLGTKGTSGVSKLASAFTGLSSKISSILNIPQKIVSGIMGGVGAVAAVGAVAYSIWKANDNYERECVVKAREAGEAWQQTNTSISEQTDKVRELKIALDSGTLSTEEAYNAKSELYSIQTSLADSYGKEAAGIDLVNGGLIEQIDLLNQLSAAEANKYLNSRENQKGGERATKEMTKERHYTLGSFMESYADTDPGRALGKVIEKYKDYLSAYVSGTTAKGINTISIKFTGDASEADEIINSFQNDVRALQKEYEHAPVFDSILGTSGKAVDKNNAVLEEYQKTYESYKKAQLVADERQFDFGGESKAAVSWLKEYADAVDEYNKALALGDDAQIAEAASEFERLDGAMQSLGNGSMSEYASEIAEVAKQLDTAAIAQRDFISSLDGDNKAFVDQIKSLNLDDIDLMAMLNTEGIQDGEDAFNSLIQAAIQMGVISDSSTGEVQKLVNILVKLGYVSGQTSTVIENSIKYAVKSFDSLREATESAVQSQIAVANVFADNTYLTEDAYKAIAELVGGEDKLSGCINTANGYLVTNASALQDIVGISNDVLMSNIKMAESHEMLNYHKLVSELRSLRSGSLSYSDAAAAQVATLMEQINQTQLQIAQYKLLEQQLLGVTNAYKELENAKAIDSAADYTDDLSGMISSLIGSYENHTFGTEEFNVAFKALIPQDVYSQFESAGDQIDAGWEYLNTKLARYFSFDNGNVSIDYDNVLKFVEDGLKGGAASQAAGFDIFTGTLDDFDLNPQIKSLEDFAAAYNITTEAAFALGNAISKYTIGNDDFLNRLIPESWDGELYAADQKMADLIKRRDELFQAEGGRTEGWDELTKQIFETEKEISVLRDEARENIQAHINIDSNIEEQKQKVDSLYGKLQELDESDPSYEATFNDYEQAYQDLANLIQAKNELDEPTELNIQVAAEAVQAEIDSVQEKLNGIDHNVTEAGVYVAVDSSNQAELDSLVEKLNSLNDEKHAIEVYAGIDDSGVMDSLVGIQDFKLDNKEFSVILNEYEVTTSNLNSIKSAIDSIQSKQIDIVTTYKEVGTPPAGGGGHAYGSVHAFGSMEKNGAAHVDGSVGIPASESDSMVGELGRELVVDPNRGIYYTVGDTGAELVDLPKDAIIFNHRQTEGILKYRRINSRGQAFAYGNAHFNFGGGYQFGGGSSGSSGGSSSGGRGNSSSSSSGNHSSSSSTKEDDYNPFEEAYKQHQHYLKMEQESLKDYLAWLEKAYKEAYQNGYIDHDDYLKYEEEVYDKSKELFDDYLNDLEFQISLMEREPGKEGDIINMYIGMFNDINAELKKAYDRGLTDDDEYIQELLKRQLEYADAIKDLQDDATDDAMGAVEDLIKYRIKMLKQELQNQRDALKERLSDLKDFYSDQKDLLKKAKEDEKYIEEQSEKRKAKSDIEAELEQLSFDDSAWAQKRKLQLQEELAKADKNLNDFEKDHAYDTTVDFLDSMLKKQEEQIELQIKDIEAQLNDPDALYNQALRDIQNNTEKLYVEMVDYNNDYGDGNPETVKEMWDEARESLDKYFATFGQAYKNILLVASTNYGITGYASGTSNATPGLHRIFEQGDEYMFRSSDGSKYRMFSGGEKVLNADATSFLYNFANSGREILSKMFAGIAEATQFKGLSPAAAPAQISMGDIIIQGNADMQTVSEIRRAQRENMNDVLKRLAKLNK